MRMSPEVIAFVLKVEGGYVNNPNDRGGETNWGISKRSYPSVDIKNLTRQGAIDIYERDYWRGGRCDEIGETHPDLALAHMDWCVNHGVGGAAKFLQRAVGATPDGAIGPKTLAAVRACDEFSAIAYYLNDRARWYHDRCAQLPSQREFLAGWLARLRHLARHCGVPIAPSFARGPL